MTEPVNIDISIKPKLSLSRLITAPAMQVGVIGLGVWCDSVAMQWAGFLALILISFAILMITTMKDKGLTIPEARRRLDEIEATT